MIRRRLSALAAFLALAMACGGRTVLDRSDSGTSSDAGSGRGSSSSGSGTGACVDIPITSADQACSSDQDCQFAVSGQVCTGECNCPDVAVNSAAAATILSETSSLGLGECPCVFAGEPRCSGGQCTISACGPLGCGDGGAGDGGVVNDGGSGGEGGLGDGASVEAGLVDGSVCVNIDITTYSLACTTASDCIDIFIGDLCSPSACTCYQAYVSITEQARYDQAINQLPPNTCTCSTLPPARCFSGSCVHG